MAAPAPKWLTEFPHFPADAIPKIPAGFTDESWGNDTSPSFRNEEIRILLWVEHPIAAEREFPEMPRFTALPFGEDGLTTDEGGFSSDDWAETLAFINSKREWKACRFSFEDSDKEPVFDGFANGETWNGWPVVKVDARNRGLLITWLNECEDGGQEATELLAAAPGPDGLYRLDGYTPQIEEA